MLPPTFMLFFLLFFLSGWSPFISAQWISPHPLRCTRYNFIFPRTWISLCNAVATCHILPCVPVPPSLGTTPLTDSKGKHQISFILASLGSAVSYVLRFLSGFIYLQNPGRVPQKWIDLSTQVSKSCTSSAIRAACFCFQAIALCVWIKTAEMH